MKAEHESSSSVISSLEACIRDKDKHIEMLHSQRQRSGVENEEEVNRVKRVHEKLEARVTSLKEQLSDKEVGSFPSFCNHAEKFLNGTGSQQPLCGTGSKS